MRYQILNLPGNFLGQVECTGDVCRRPVKPGPGYVAPARTIGKREALSLSHIIGNVIETNPSCFEGEDLSVAYALQEKLRSYGEPTPEGWAEIALDPVLMPLSEEEARVAGRAEVCSRGPVIQTAVPAPGPGGQPLPTTGRISTTAPLPAGPAAFPIVPVAIGAGALGLIALIVSIVK